MPAIDLSKVKPGLPDVVLDVKPLIDFDVSKMGLKTADQLGDIKPLKDVRCGV